ncbi:hypothetical protein [Leptospira adleri]|uniref:Uncharacterized protein n=1 Tax=Leptospira adleri TaxID=2023186 RepID=A0A2M9YJF4_9LEPT|nr:hypothetical protein [Leptospira adleri]PJZ51668.1 hypothetical protein CH380_18830 [Leptospira adleri]PJZ62153.1 hypothetical protein CH376_09455 [Leptospira adleri]
MKLSADVSAGNLRLDLGRNSELGKSEFQNLSLNPRVKALVLEIFPGGAWISLAGKRIKTSSDSTPMFVGEILTLAAKSGKRGVELKIIERELSTIDSPLSKLQGIGMSVRDLSEKMYLQNPSDNSVETSLLRVLKSYYPFIEWTPELPHFRWEFPEGNAEGTLDVRQEMKKFLFRIQTEKTGKTLVLFLWKERAGEDLQINATFDNFKMYLHACQNKEKFKRILNESSVSFQGYNIAYKASLTRKEWNA